MEDFIYKGKSADQFIVKDAPCTVRYLPNFITAEEEEHLIEQVDSAPAPKWHTLRDRRVQDWGGIVGKHGLIPDSGIPQWLETLIDKIVSVSDIFPVESRPNHVLINDYAPGDGIMEHTDGPAYYPVVATISLASDLIIDYTRNINPEVAETWEDRYIGSMILEARSLILLSDYMFSSNLHGIANRTTDVVTGKTFNRDTAGKEVGSAINRKRRISLTIRNVPRVRRSVASFLRK